MISRKAIIRAVSSLSCRCVIFTLQAGFGLVWFGFHHLSSIVYEETSAHMSITCPLVRLASQQQGLKIPKPCHDLRKTDCIAGHKLVMNNFSEMLLYALY